MSEIYVVKNIGDFPDEYNEYVGPDAQKAQRLCDRYQSGEKPCFIQVWEDGEKQYVTREL